MGADVRRAPRPRGTAHATWTVLACGLLALGTPALHAGAQGVDPRGEWVTLATPHFRVHFRPALEDQGRRAAAEAEVAWALLAAELAPPSAPVDLVVADNADVSNGYATPLPTNRIVVYAQPPIDASSLRSFYGDWLQIVITHELTHIFHLDRARGIWQLGRYVFGRNPGLFPNRYGPSWLSEGLAVYFESRLTGEGRLLGSQHRLIARAAAVDGAVPRIDQLSLAGSVFPLGERAYTYGSILVDHVARAGGPQHVRSFVDRQSAQLLPWRLDHVARQSFGLSFSDAWRRWSDSLTREVRALPKADGWRELTHEGWFVQSPRWIDARSIVVAVNDGRDVTGAERVTLDGGTRRIGRRNNLSANVPLAAGGLLFAQIDYEDPYTLRSDLYVQSDTSGARRFGAASAGQRRLTHGARLSHPDARADGAIVAVQSGAGTTWLARVSSDGRTVVPLTPAAPDTQWTEPRWSPDGRRIAAVQLVRGGRSAVVVLDSAGGTRVDVVRDGAVNAAPSWSRDGRRLYFVSDRTGAPQVYAASLGDDGRPMPPVLLSGVSTGLVEPAPGPDGGVLAALLYHADGYHVAVTDIATLRPTPAAAEPSYDRAVPRGEASAQRAVGPAAPYSPWRTLWPRYWTPIGGQSDGGSVTLGAATSGNDVLVRHAYAAQAAWNVDNGDMEAGLGYRYARFGQPLVDLNVSQGWQYDSTLARFTSGRLDTLPIFRRTRAVGATFSLTRPRIRTGASLALGVSYERRAYTSTLPSLVDLFADRVGTSFPAVSLSGAWLNTRRPVRSISPEDGVAVSGTVQQRWQNGRLGPQSRRAVGAGRLFKSLDLPGFAHHVVALRVAGGVADSRSATEFGAGGVNGGSVELVPGVVVGTSTRTFGVRGFNATAQQGLRAAAGSFEYRAPLALPSRGARLLPVFADRLSLSAFADAASAWCPGNVDRTAQPLCLGDRRRSPSAPRWLASVGGELGLDGALSYDAAYRFRVGVAAPVAERDLAPRAISVYFTLGLAF